MSKPLKPHKTLLDNRKSNELGWDLKRHHYSDPMRFWIYWIYTLVMVVIIAALCRSANAQTIEDRITRAALSEGVNPQIALAIAEVESSFNPSAVGGLGEIGLFQLRPEYHDVRRGQVDHNIQVAVKYLAHLQKRCAGYGDAFFVCFNYGPARKLKHPRRFPYYRRVMEVVERNKNEAQYLARMQ